MTDEIMRGRCIVKGVVEAEALVTGDCISFMGSTDPKTGCIIERGHELEGQCMKGKILCFPSSKGSTGGSYMLYDAVKRGVGPAGIVNVEAENVVVIGAIVSELPMVDGIDVGRLATGDVLRLDATQGTVEILKKA